jgi:class 3 adenylate cyclase
VIAGTLYTFYDVRVLIIGYVLLVIAALYNQLEIVKQLKQRVELQAEELKRFNESLERRVADEVSKNARLTRLKRFLSPEVVDIITSEGKEDLLESHRRYIACLFCDIRDFTALSSELEPEEVMEILGGFHEMVGQMVARSNGTIGYRAGDGLMVFFNDPLPTENPSSDAASLALEIRDVSYELRKKWKRMRAEISIGIGIASGYATIGFVGESGRRDYTAIGNAVNIAARLCDKANADEILIAGRSKEDLGEGFELGDPRQLELKGVNEPCEAFPLISKPVHPKEA